MAAEWGADARDRGNLAPGEYRAVRLNFTTAGEIPSRRLRFRYNPLEFGEMAEWLKAAVC
jgi:hypothetical protein